ncbi:sensor histidine kinase KdpD [Serratia sp. DD3]|uniref:sensor histidine kinase n=1 Tax=Serratia sp. DD3 TaxID=1410619 RepID=UPI0004D42293|nr:HAMP domain-containing sensor histidine kinase [Serratia sp. DD3]KEY60687.1 autoinducer 2 sensor kinase/phosphatase LuxQ [Serratia sp. DD3]
MSKKLLGILISLFVILALSMVLIAISFEKVKYRYNEIEPNLDNYSAAEILYLSFERIKTSLLLSDNEMFDEFETKLNLFKSKINILEGRSTYSGAFYHDDEFLGIILKLKKQTEKLDIYSKQFINGEVRKDYILDYMSEMEDSIIDLQEVIYKIQIANFNEVKEIIKDNSGKAEFFAIISLILLSAILILITRNSMNLREVIKKKNLFISSIYHELASSTQAIVIAADIIEHELTQSELRNEVKLISFHVDKIIEQTKEVMDYSKIEIGNALINESMFDINSVLHDAVMELSKRSKNKIKMQNSVCKKYIVTDKYKIYRIVVNLLDNADKNTENGTVIIKSKIMRSHLFILIKDNGIGFNISRLDDLYKAFNQGVEKDTKQGLGLGLTIIKNYVDLLHGHIRVKSLLNHGSSFLISIPILLVEK